MVYVLGSEVKEMDAASVRRFEDLLDASKEAFMTGEVEFGLHLMERAKTHLAMNQELRRARPSHRGYFGPEVLLPQNQTPWAAIYGSHSEPAMIAFTNLTCAGFEYLAEEFAKEVPDRVHDYTRSSAYAGLQGSSGIDTALVRIYCLYRRPGIGIRCWPLNHRTRWPRLLLALVGRTAV